MMKNKISGNKGLIIAVIAAFILLASAREFFAFLTDWLFFREVGFEEVFAKTFTAKLLTGLVFGAAAFLVLFINVHIARKRAFPRSGVHPLWDSVPQLRGIDPGRVIGWLTLGAALLAFAVAFPIGARYWEQALLFVNSAPAGLADPLLGKDISFFLFRYHVLDGINTLARGLIVAAALLTAAVYLLRGGLVFRERSFSIDGFVRRHLGVLVSLFLVSLAASFVLDRYGLLTTEHGVLYGASYTDVHARLAMLWGLAALSVAAAIVIVLSTGRRTLVIPLLALGALAGVYVLGLKVYPSMVQSFKVSPNEIVLEQPFIEHHIRFTRYGYGLENIEQQPFAADRPLTFTDIRKNLSTIRNIRLWDEEPLLKTYSQRASTRTPLSPSSSRSGASAVPT